MLQRVLSKLTTQQDKTSKGKQTDQDLEMGVLKRPQNCHKDGKLLSKSRCKCEPKACKCSKKKQQQQQQQLERQQSLLLSQLRRRGADNLSSVILF